MERKNLTISMDENKHSLTESITINTNVCCKIIKEPCVDKHDFCIRVYQGADFHGVGIFQFYPGISCVSDINIEALLLQICFEPS